MNLEDIDGEKNQRVQCSLTRNLPALKKPQKTKRTRNFRRINNAPVTNPLMDCLFLRAAADAQMK